MQTIKLLHNNFRYCARFVFLHTKVQNFTHFKIFWVISKVFFYSFFFQFVFKEIYNISFEENFFVGFSKKGPLFKEWQFFFAKLTLLDNKMSSQDHKTHFQLFLNLVMLERSNYCNKDHQGMMEDPMFITA